MLDQMAAGAGYEYTMHLPSDNTRFEVARNGTELPPNEGWGTYKQAQADVTDTAGIGDFYAGGFFITPGRVTKLALTVPFQNVGLDILQLRQAKGSALLAFLRPFSFDLWGIILAVILGAGVVFWMLEADMVRVV
jgi:hypothetical protein